MSNSYGISEADERTIRARDTRCVYCHKIMKEFSVGNGPYGDMATIEHFNNDNHLEKFFNLAICCGSCNSSRGNKELKDWFKTSYCTERGINAETVAEPVKQYMRSIGR